MPLVEKRYAEALFNVSLSTGNIEKFQQQLKTIVEIYNTQEDYKFFFLNPEVTKDIKKDTLLKIFTGNIEIELLNFLMLLVDKGRTAFIPGIYTEFVELADKMKNVLYISITSASPIDENQINSIKEKYRKLYNSSYVKADLNIDKSLIGGIKVQIGDKVIDSSVKSRLESIKAFILES